MLSGCVSTKPVEADVDNASPAQVDAALESTDDSTEPEPDTIPDETDATRQVTADQCAPSEVTGERAAQADCADDSATDGALLDRAQSTVFGVVNGSTRWFDGFFGETPLNDADHVSRGRLTASGYWDQRDQFSGRVNLRARYALPAMQQRARLVVGRGDTDDLIDGTEEPFTDGLPGSFDSDRDDDWLIGLGFSRSGDLKRGFDLGVGVKVATPLEPYVRLTYRWNRIFRDTTLLSIRPRVFWQSQRGTGATLHTDLGHTFSPTFLVRWANNFAVEDEIEGLGWRSDLLAYQGLSDTKALSYGLFAYGESDAAVEVQNYGFELRYRQRIYREWFFIQLSSGVSWPRELPIEVRKSNFGVGVLFEMRFGQW